MKTNTKSTQSEDSKQLLAQAHRHQAPKKSTFSDLEDTLKDIERSRELFEDNMKTLLRHNHKTNDFSSISTTPITNKCVELKLYDFYNENLNYLFI